MSRQELRRVQVKTLLAVIWSVFTVSMVGWWWVFALKQSPLSTASDEALKHHRMFLWEGSILLTVIAIGGAALIFLSYRDQMRHERLQTFFATFSHDMKTSITRLRLQAEVLEEEAGPQSPLLQRLINDIARLDLQLENSLLLSSPESVRLLPERLRLSQLLESLRTQWPELQMKLDQDAELVADRRAFSSVLKNIIQNSVLHGGASLVRFQVKALSPHLVQIQVEDNGQGFRGAVEELGQPVFQSHNNKGSGIGLYLCRRLLQRMNGRLDFKSSESGGFQALIQIEGRPL